MVNGVSMSVHPIRQIIIIHTLTHKPSILCMVEVETVYVLWHMNV
jgi:hypothetical protein